MENRNSTNTVLHHGKNGVLTGPDKEHAETSMLALNLLHSTLVHVNTLLLQQVLAEPTWERLSTEDQGDRRGLTGTVPVAHQPLRHLPAEDGPAARSRPGPTRPDPPRPTPPRPTPPPDNQRRRTGARRAEAAELPAVALISDQPMPGAAARTRADLVSTCPHVQGQVTYR
ncbi:Tn3 family transposase [Streptomyces sp. NPDC048845]|uniref:Tn3 family transposase n=1 Tax=Streptomyces sp. NPDC048845 TaxID=3155390 RepID=UPI003433769F